MTKYILKRLLRSLITIAIVFVVVFMLLRFMPLNGYFPDEMIKETDEQTRMAYLRNLGLLDHPIVQLGRFVKNLFKGDLGRSITVYPKVPITTLLAEKIPVTAFLGFWSMLLGIVAGLAMGLMMVRQRIHNDHPRRAQLAFPLLHSGADIQMVQSANGLLR